MLMRPPYGDHAPRPVSSYRMNSTLGASFGAAFGVNGVQSGLESRMSSLISPLKSAGGLGVASAGLLSCARRAGRRPDPASQPNTPPSPSTAIMINRG